MGNHIPVHGQKRFPCALVTQKTQEEFDKTYKGINRHKKKHLLILVQYLMQKNKKKEGKMIIKKYGYEIITPGYDADFTSLANGRSNVFKSSQCVPNFPSSYHDACKNFLITVKEGFVHLFLYVLTEEVGKANVL